MSLRNTIDDDYKQSIKDRDQQKTNTLRLIKSAIKDKDISSRSGSNKEVINDNEILSLLISLIKQRKDSIEQFQIANRDDLIINEQNEIDLIKIYLPQQKSEEETEKLVSDLIQSNNLQNIKDMGKLMGLIKKDYAGEVDMGLVGKLAKSKLGN
ncbi:MAG: GatB/YqeY domain-containing protein [Pelagibacteraceae bacterium]|nr:GatB/YqeY domain-containing protein [Pelagibacteraceae bacterium]MBT6197237.1 GatB/YqeY domain-containing protein [Pelagibacteraceae bacterium]